MTPTVETLRAAQGDAWQVLGDVRSAEGGATAVLPGVRVMSSGLLHPQWNSGDVHAPAEVALDEVAAWFGALGVPWGLRLAAGAEWPHGRKLLRQRLMGLDPDRLRTSPDVDGLVLGLAGVDDLDEVADVDAVAFESEAAVGRSWLRGNLGAPGVDVALARLHDEVVGTAYCVRSDGWAGPAAYVAGVAVAPSARRRGIGARMTCWLVQRAVEDGSAVVHLNPDDDPAASLYARLGFVEMDGFDIYVDVGGDRGAGQATTAGLPSR